MHSSLIETGLVCSRTPPLDLYSPTTHQWESSFPDFNHPCPAGSEHKTTTPTSLESSSNTFLNCPFSESTRIPKRHLIYYVLITLTLNPHQTCASLLININSRSLGITTTWQALYMVLAAALLMPVFYHRKTEQFNYLLIYYEGTNSRVREMES